MLLLLKKIFKRILFDYDVGIHTQKEDFLKKRETNVPFRVT